MKGVLTSVIVLLAVVYAAGSPRPRPRASPTGPGWTATACSG
jgi:hypothetical protein